MGTNITGIGNANAIGFKSRVTGGAYFPPELKDALVGVWSAYGKSNDSTDRNIIKNKIKDKGGDFVISNAAFKLNSGFGKYSADFESFDWAINISQKQHNKATISLNGRLCNHTAIEIDEMKVNIIGNVTELIYWYIANPDDTTRSEIRLTSGINTLPKSYAKDDGQTYNIGFAYISGDSEITIEQIPSFEGAFVTDGIDDLIKSTKSATEMLDGSNEVTVVSMIHQIKTNDDTTRNNWFFTPVSYLENRVVKDKIGKTGIYGYTSTNVTNAQISDITPILGDKNDYTLYSKIEDGDRDYFTVEGFQNQGIWYVSSIAWYWTIIANKVLTTDQINQVIAYFNLDRTLKSDIYCNIAKQGITNENHAEFGDKLIDFSGNGRDIQLNNIAWDGDSGIGKYNYPNWKVTATIANTYSTIVNYPTVNGTYSINVNGVSELMQSIGLHLEIKYTTSTGIIYNDIKQDGVYSYILPDGATDLTLRFGGIPGIVNEPCNITITQIPSHAGALCLDGVNDFGQFVGDLELKDYTFIADRAYSRIAPSQVPFIASTQTNGQAPFLMEYLNEDTYVYPHSFGTTTKTINLNIQRQISYQSTYVYNGNSISKGISVDTGDGLTIGNSGSTGAQYSPLCLWSLMLFPYSMSEFLIERQLKKHKLGTLYPDMVEFRPVINSNVLLDSKPTFVIRGTSTHLNAGDYVPENSQIWVSIKMNNIADRITKFTVNGKTIDIPENAYSEVTLQYGFPFVIDKSPQKIGITIDEYIRYEDIVQPYPVLLRFNDENGNEVSWGGKFRVGSTITIIGSAADSNLLPNIYNIFGLLLNDNQVTSSKVIVEKTMVFKAKSAYIFDNNEPNCILSPRLLRIPNSSYKILGHIPDISGHGNHGVIHNSAYEGMSGANGYKYDYKNFLVDKVLAQIDDDRKVTYFAAKNSVGFFNANSASYKGRIKLTGVKKAIDDKFIDVFRIYTNSRTSNEAIDIYEDGEYDVDIKGADDATRLFFFALTTSESPSTLNTPIVIEQIGEYEGAYCFDGVDDFVTIPTLSSGGKQVLMKVNSRKSDCYLYDQRNNWTQYLGIVSTKDFIAYNYSNQRGKTYIDGILNENITANDLIDITHNITVTNNRDDVKQYSPCIGTSFARNSFAQMALYDFMLFDNISTDDKIKELNEYIGLSGNIFEFNPPTFTIDLPMAIKNIKVYQGGNEISPGYLYSNKDTEFEVYVSLNDGKYAVDTITVDGVEITKDRVVGEYNIFKFTLNGSSEQKITIHSYEYIMYEDIIQPYPSFVKLENLDRTHTYTWGDKLRIGDTIRYNSSKNLLEGAYTLRGQLECNGVYVFDNNQQIVVTKEMVFAWSHSPVWTIGNSAPKCVFSPSKLRIPNSSYKYLGYIPDISGNGNNGVFNNFAFSKMSGADGYPYDYKSTSDFVVHARNAVLVNSETVKFINVLTQTSFYYKGTSYKGKIKVTGITKAIASGKVRYLDIYSNSPTNNDRVIIDKDGTYDVNIETEDAIDIFFYLTPIVSGTTALDEPVYLEQVGNYEGSICFDGVDDYMDIPSLSIGGKQVLMKTNWLKSPTLLYDQRASGSFAILTTKEDDATNPRIAYQARNQDGKTYIDGIENNYIETYSLKGITHNITVTNPSAGSGVVPVIGANTGKSSSFAKMALYDFMLFDEVSTNEEIKQLNDIVGIEGNYVQRPPYYWDTHGKSNLDGDRGTIPQLGTAEDYSFTSFDNEIDWYLSSSNYIDVVSRNGYKITLKNLSTGIDGWRFQNSTVKRFILNDIPFKIKSNKTIRVYWDMHYNAISSTELRQKVVSVTTINPNEDTLINLRHLTEEELTELNVNKSTMYYLLWFDVSTLAVNEEVTIEMLPVEGGRNLWLNNYGFAYDKMSGYEGYSFKSFNDSQSWNIRGDSTGVEIISRNGYSMTVKKLVQNLDWQISNNEYRYPTILDKEVPFKCKSNKNVGLIWQLKYKTEGATSDTTVTLINQQLTPNVPLEISLPYKTQDELTELGAVSTSVYYLLYFSNTLLEIGEEYTVEMLPLYPNGLVYDGVDDYSENISIPAFTDYTYIFKRTLLNKKYNSASVFKGSNQQSGGGAFICDYNSVEPELMIQGYSFGAGLYANSLNTNDIVYGTKNSVNGQTITSGNNADTEGLTIGKWRAYKQMVFYKLMLYPRTTDMLTINMIKNMMAEDGIIDIQGKLFTDKFTGDFNLDFNKDFLIGN